MGSILARGSDLFLSQLMNLKVKNGIKYFLLAIGPRETRLERERGGLVERLHCSVLFFSYVTAIFPDVAFHLGDERPTLLALGTTV